MRSFHKSLLAIAVSATSFTFTGCSGSDSPTVAGEEINGSVFASYVDGAIVNVTDESGNTIAGPVSTNDQGEFTVRIPKANLADNLIFKAIGGEYRDEATGETATNSTLSAFISANTLAKGNDTQFSLSPDSTIIQELVSEHELDLATAKERFETAFGYTADASIIPVDATAENADASDAQKLAGLRSATFSQLTKDLSLPADSQGPLLKLLAQDIADGSFDGKSNDLSLAIESITVDQDLQNRFSNALVNFRSAKDGETNIDKSGLANNQIGTLPFSKVAVSENYIVKFVPTGSMMIKNGKSQFQLVITDKEGEPATGLSPMIMPMMYMQAHEHSTPKLMVSESNTAGTYDATVYYVMASVMGTGDTMGYWKIKVTIGDESVDFYPKVMMAMGDTVHAKLRGQEDKMPTMGGGEMKRPYEIFKESLSIDDNGADFSVFITTRESMMSFPALTDGLVLNKDTDYELSVSNIAVEMSTNKETWTTASDDGNGFWSADDLPIENDGSAQSIYVKLSVNGEQKTDSGLAPDGTPDGPSETVEFKINSSSAMGM